MIHNIIVYQIYIFASVKFNLFLQCLEFVYKKGKFHNFLSRDNYLHCLQWFGDFFK